MIFVQRVVDLVYVGFLVNGEEKRFTPTNDFRSFKVSKHAQIEVMDWKVYVKPLKMMCCCGIGFYFF